MIIECPKEVHEEWFNKWTGYEKFKFGQYELSFPFVAVFVMEDMKNQFTVLDMMESLSQNILFLHDYMYITLGDETDMSVAVKLQMFQSYGSVSSYHIPPYTDASNKFNTLADDEP